MTDPEKPSFAEALRFWLRLGWISFGGTMGHLAIMHDFLVKEKEWISDKEFLHALDHCMLLPGPEAQELATYVGWKLHGVKGGLAAGILFVLPSTLIILALSVIYVQYGNVGWLKAIFTGLKPTVLALILVALLRVGRKALRGPLHVITAGAAFLAMFIWNAPLPIIMLLALMTAIGVHYVRPSLFGKANGAKKNIGFQTSSPLRLWPIMRPVLIALTFFLVPLTLLHLFLPAGFQFWSVLVLFFTKTAFVTIGGSYTVIPYVAQASVNSFHWLSKAQMMDGFALAETTPGPLIIVLAFVGFMAAFTHFGSVMMGVLGLIITTFYTFLPCFLFVFVGAPLIERTHGRRFIAGFLSLVTAVVLGAIVDLTLFLGKGILFRQGHLGWNDLDIVALIWVVVILLLLTRTKVRDMHVVFGSVVFGLARWSVELNFLTHQ